jgi:hypothetical protein
MWISSTPPSSVRGQERLEQRRRDLLGVMVGRLVGEARPLCAHRDPGSGSTHRLAADQERHDLEALLGEQRGELLPSLMAVRGVGAREPTVGRHDQHRRALAHPLVRLGQRVPATRVRRGRGDGSDELARVGQSSLDPLLGLDDARGRDELHRLRDLLGRLDGLDPSSVDPKLCTHGSIRP